MQNNDFTQALKELQSIEIPYMMDFSEALYEASPDLYNKYDHLMKYADGMFRGILKQDRHDFTTSVEVYKLYDWFIGVRWVESYKYDGAYEGYQYEIYEMAPVITTSYIIK